MTYAPKPGSLPDQVVNFLQTQPAGSTLSVAQMVEQFGADSTTAATLLRRTVNNGLLTATRPAGNAPYVYALGAAIEAPKVSNSVVLMKAETTRSPVTGLPMPALLASATIALLTGPRFAILDLRCIVRSRTNPRTYFEPVALQGLADSIAAIGLGQPILVRPLPGHRVEETAADRERGAPLPTHEIIAGERRWLAAQMAGMTEIPVLVRDMADEAVLHMQIVENVQREGLHPLEEAHGYRAIIDLPSQADKPMKERIQALADEIKKSTRYIYQTMQLEKLCNFAANVFLDGKLERTTALQIARIGNEAQQIEATRRIAGLGSKGTDVVDDPMSQRAAEHYVQRTFMLVLSKATFPIEDAGLAGAPACGACPSNSANALLLFDEGHKGPPTCMDPSCYGKKNVAHGNRLADVARQAGQRVITGKKAQEIAPYRHSPDALKGYASLDSRRYDVIDKLQGQTLRQILGQDMPKPVLVQNLDGGFIECLPEADVKQLLKERGLLHGRAENDEYKAAQRAAEKKLDAERGYRKEAAAQILARAGAMKPAPLLASLLVPVAVQMYLRLDHECQKRARKLMEWDDELPGSHDKRAELAAHFEALTPADLNCFYAAACVVGDFYVNTYSTGNRTPGLDTIAPLVDVDLAAIKKQIKDEARAKEKEKAAKAKGKGKPVAKVAAGKKAEQQLDLSIADAARRIDPVAAWPFPHKGETPAQARARSVRALQ